MEMIFCPNCQKLAGYKRVLGFGTFFAVLLTAGFWLLALPFYPKRCITCGLRKTESVPWYRTWRIGMLVFASVLLLGGLALRIEDVSRDQPAPVIDGSNYNKPANKHSTNAPATAVATEDDSPNRRVRISDNEIQFVRSIQGAWSKPTLLYSDDSVKVYMPFDDQLGLGASFPERNWSKSSFEVLLFAAKGKMPSAKWAAGESYTEERVSIDTMKLQFTIVARKFIDDGGNASATTPDEWREPRDLADSQWQISRFLTGEIVRRLTEPQRIALNSLDVHSLDELAWDHHLREQYLTLMRDQAEMQRGLGPEH
jgi:hypothetical protein